jgi:hypothetical protein
MQAQLSYDHCHDVLYADIYLTIIRPSSRRHLYRCKYNYHAITGDGLYAHVNGNIIRSNVNDTFMQK